MRNHQSAPAAKSSSPVGAVAVALLGTADTAPTGLSPPHKDEAPRLAGAEGFRDQRQNEQADCAARPMGHQEGQHLAYLAAAAAGAGATLHHLAGGYLLCRWGHCRELPDLRAVALLLRRMGVRS